MGKIRTKTIEKVPQWETCYLYYGDDSGLDIESGEKELADDFEDRLRKEGFRLVCPIEGTESGFEPYPAFGLACETIDWTAEEIPNTYELEYRETLATVVKVEAYSRREAIAEANEILKDGRYAWDCIGHRLHRCKEIR